MSFKVFNLITKSLENAFLSSRKSTKAPLDFLAVRKQCVSFPKNKINVDISKGGNKLGLMDPIVALP